ncbi:hypothetical protein PHL163M00_28 [Propionibacterium phage PHL163M00]|uniref:Uncharacterized protein n=4 Tax=Pahexavirus TaxID=1982251 RepID=A0A0E3DLY6_9CAUD|nr:hypothetical protein PHL194M00_28 [Propionibacterium phage PHL194M00]YP_009153232.1 hypothetical protein ACQ81_gp28 [Propionibacterium phage PHL055N00]YP_009153586.1 hypothetical protein PHL117M00_28 [Propionibacterium phage PHL117M00]YP_009153902.1 hypothetical protein PHL163M00_28 [Propionibacterium phage PHL163M00]AII28789.1 hypothetical protein PHL055N00_28 [Propionibacterium phage PHL055N00]AII29518.1 hypothetical protein PHL117M00_28 [Propionibacterium phage PHL117M00]AII29878.1 hypo
MHTLSHIGGMMVTTTQHVTETNRDNNGKFPEHLRDVMCGKTLNHTDGTVSWCTRKPGHDGNCRTGWQPTTQPMGHHGNQN